MQQFRCSECKSYVPVTENENYFVLECCNKHIEQKDKNEVIRIWNEENRKYYYLFGLDFEVDEKTETVVRNLDFFIEYSNEEEDQIKLMELLRNVPLHQLSMDGYLSYHYPEGAVILNSLHGAMIRVNANCQRNLKLCKVEAKFQMTREELQQLIKFVPKNKLDAMIIR